MRPHELADRRESVQLVDVRTPAEWDAGHIAGTRNIPLADLPGRTADLEPGVPVVTVCRTGHRSGRAVELLRGLGIHADHIEGGVAAWDELGLPLVTPAGARGRIAASPGAATPQPGAGEGEDEDEEGGAFGRDVQTRVLGLVLAAQEHFGDDEPTDAQARAFFERVLAEEGRTPEEIAALLD